MDIVAFEGADFYARCKENLLPERRFKYTDFCSVLRKHFQKSSIKFLESGFSYERREIRRLVFGSGATGVLIVSQMHGNEPVSTLALTDVLNFLETDFPLAQRIKSSLTLTVIPLLNPDGHVRFDRRNAQGIDINRDATALTSPEARFLRKVYDEVRPEFFLNLHDMELYYMSRPKCLQTALAVLAPECDEKGSFTAARKKAAKVISCVAETLRPLATDRIARYCDVFTPEAFGDSFMGAGTSSVLLEAGSSPGDKERSFARKTLFYAILTALDAAAEKKYETFSEEIYHSLPENVRYKNFDLKIKNLTVESELGNYRIDLGIRRIKPTFNDEDLTDDFSDYRIVNIGSLEKFGALKEFEASDFVFCGKHSGLFIGKEASFEIVNKKNEKINVKTLL